MVFNSLLDVVLLVMKRGSIILEQHACVGVNVFKHWQQSH